MTSDRGSPALARVLAALPEAVLATHAQHGDATAVIARDRILDVMRFAKGDAQLELGMLSDLCAVDLLPREPRFEVVYHLYSVTINRRLRLKVRVPEDDAEVASAVALYRSANWMEREVFDLYGIRFRGHPDLRRILLYDEFEGHPLRKDYPKRRQQPLIP